MKLAVRALGAEPPVAAVAEAAVVLVACWTAVALGDLHREGGRVRAVRALIPSILSHRADAV